MICELVALILNAPGLHRRDLAERRAETAQDSSHAANRNERAKVLKCIAGVMRPYEGVQIMVHCDVEVLSLPVLNHPDQAHSHLLCPQKEADCDD